MAKLKLFLLTGLLAAAVAPMYGCGSECGPGTIEQDGQCVLVAEGCGEGTILENKACVVNTTGCAIGTTLSEEGKCVPAKESCAEGTSFDQATHVCVSNADIVCGANTEATDEGTCVPSAETCADKTVLDDDGRCIVEAAACGQGTELDPTTGKCNLAAAACGEGLAIDASGECVPTTQVCGAGTAFDEDSGLCLSDSCQEGDVFVDGICMNPAEELAHNADITESENNDPALGGTAEAASLNTPGDDAFVFAGAIGAPTELDTDGVADQDVDVFEFEATAGQWIEVMVQSTGLPAPAFKVEGPNGYVRYSRIGSTRDVARNVVTPTTGTYTVTVLPSLVLTSQGEAEPSGNDNWSYVGTLNVVDVPVGTDVSISGGTAMSGELTNLSDNLFNLTGLTDTDTVKFTTNGLGDDAQAVLQVWADPFTLHSSQPIVEHGTVLAGVPPTGDALVLIDWIASDGPDSSFDVSAELSGKQVTATVPPGATETLTLSANPFDRVVLRQSNPSDAALNVVLKNPSGDIVAGRRIGVNQAFATVVFESGDFTAELSNTSAATVDVRLMGHVSSPSDLGAIAADGIATSSPLARIGGDSSFYALSANAGEVVAFTHDNAEANAADITVYNQDGDLIGAFDAVDATSSSGFDSADYNWVRLDAASSLIVQVESRSARSAATLTADSITPISEGDVSVGTPSATTNSATQAQGRSFFHTVHLLGTDVGYAGTLTASGSSNLDLHIYDAQGDDILSATESGDEVFGDVPDAVGSYLVEVVCVDPCTGYDLSFEAFSIVENLGTPPVNDTYWSPNMPVLADGQSLTLNFTVPPGHIIELGHRTKHDEDADLFLLDSSGETLVENTYAWPIGSSQGAELLHHYTETGGDFTYVLTGEYDGSYDAQAMIRIIDPTDLGALSTTTRASHTDSTPLVDGQWYVHQFDVGANSTFYGSVTPLDMSQDLDVELTDSHLSSIDTWSGAAEVVSFSQTVADASTLLMITECQDSCTGVTFDAGLLDPAQLVDPLGGLTADATTPHAIGALATGEPRKLTFSVPQGQVIEISHTNTEMGAHGLRLVDTDGESLQYDADFAPSNDTANAEYMYWYSKDGGDFTLEIEANSAVTAEEIAFRLFAPATAGALDAASTTGVSTTVADSCAAGQSYFQLVDFVGAMGFSGTLHPASNEDLDFYMYSLTYDEEVHEQSSGGADVVFSDTAIYPGKRLVRVNCNEAATGYTLDMSAGTSIQENLGTLTPGLNPATTLTSFAEGQVQVYTFTVPAGYVFEIGQDNVGSDDQDAWLLDANGTELLNDTYFYAESYSYNDWMYWYAHTESTYSFVLQAEDAATDQSVTIRMFQPTDLGAPLAHGESVSYTATNQLVADKSDMYLVTFAEDGWLGAKTVAGFNADTDLEVFDLSMNELGSAMGAGLLNTSGTELSAGTYLLGLSTQDNLSTYDLTVKNVAPVTGVPDFLSTPNVTLPDDDLGGIDDTLTASGCATIVSVDVWVQYTHEDTGDPAFSLTSPAGTTVVLRESTSGGSAGSLQTVGHWYPAQHAAVGDMSQFAGETGDGSWTLTAADGQSRDRGTLDEWGVRLTCQ